MITHGSLFAGIGGFDYGFAQAGITTLWAVEIEPYCQKVLKKNFPETEIFSDVKEVHGPMAHAPKIRRDGRRPTREGIRRGDAPRNEVGKCCGSCLPRVDILSGGFPCQDISVAGRQEGIDGARSGLWSEFDRIIGELEPWIVVIENVANLVGLGLERVLCDLAKRGYDAEWQIISANDVGAHHLRKRIWIIAYPQRFTSCTDTNSVGSYREKVDQQGKIKFRDEQECESRSMGENVADTAEIGCEGNRADRQQESQTRDGSSIFARNSTRSRSNLWSTEPNVGELVDGLPAGLASQFTTRDIPRDYPIPRVATKIPDRVNKLKGFGNAVIPQIPELLGNRLVEILSDFNIE